jgi:hypothetical protein
MPHVRAAVGRAGPWAWAWAWRGEVGGRASGRRACRDGMEWNGKGFTFLIQDPISAEALQLLANKC